MLKRLLSSQLRINMASGVVVTVINAVAMMVAYPIYLHFLGYEKYGVWLVLATVLSFGQLGNLGLSAAVTKFVAEGVGRDDKVFIETHIVNGLLVLAIVGVSFLAVVILARGHIASLFKLTGENRETAVQLLPYVGALIVYLLITHILNATLAGLGRLDATNYIQTVGRILGVLVTVLLLSQGIGIPSMAVGYLMSYLTIHLISVAFIKRTAGIRLLTGGRVSLTCIRRLIHFGGQFMAGQSLQLLMNPFNKLVLARCVGIASIPRYEIAYTGAMMLRSLVETGLRAITPEVSRLYAKSSLKAAGRIEDINRRVTVGLGAIVSPLYLVILIASPFLFRVWLGNNFDSYIPCLFQIMAVGTLISLFGICVDKTLLGLGRVRYCLMARVLQVAVSIVVVGLVVLLRPDVVELSIAFAFSAGWLAMVLYLMITWMRQGGLVVQGVTG